MKKLLAILFLSFLWFGTTSADIYEPGKNNFTCAIGGLDAYKETQDYKIKNPKDNTVVYLSCKGGSWSWNWIGGKKLKSIHKKSFNECKKNSKDRGTGECFLFSTNDLIVWEFSDSHSGSIELLKKTYTKKFGGYFYPTKEESKTARCMEGNCTNGTGTMIWPNGDQYVGEWKNSKTHGVGTLTWSNGTKYVGEWKYGKQHGQGKLTTANRFYEGKWKNGFEDRPKTIYEKKVIWDNSTPISRKKYAYNDVASLKRLIKKKAPTTLKELKFYKKTENKTFSGYQGLPEFCKSCKKEKKISYDAYIFYAHFESGNIIKILVNTKYKNFKKAEKIALRYATLMGQLPTFLNKKNGINSIIIHQGRRRWMASGKKITIYPSSDWYDHEKSLIHEAAHATVDDLLVNDADWKAAVDADGKYITKYARTNQWEDSAETVVFWVALRCADSISKGTKKRILKSIPNRIKHLDKMNLNTYPLECKK